MTSRGLITVGAGCEPGLAMGWRWSGRQEEPGGEPGESSSTGVNSRGQSYRERGSTGPGRVANCFLGGQYPPMLALGILPHYNYTIGFSICQVVDRKIFHCSSKMFQDVSTLVAPVPDPPRVLRPIARYRNASAPWLYLSCFGCGRMSPVFLSTLAL